MHYTASMASVYIWVTQHSNPTSGAKQHEEEQQQQPHDFSLWRLSGQDECK